MTEYNNKLKRELSNLLRARFPYIYIPTWEEERAVSMIQQIAADETYIRTVRKCINGARQADLRRTAGKKFPLPPRPGRPLSLSANARKTQCLS